MRAITLVFCLLMLVLPLAAAPLQAHIDVDTSIPGVWSYTVFNDEPTGSANYILGFILSVNAPIVITGVPTAWDVSTDNVSAVFWSNTDTALPYPHDIAPGSSLSGFSISSPGAVSGSFLSGAAFWDHTQDEFAGLSPNFYVAGPSQVPEPGTATLVLGSLAGLFMLGRRRLRGCRRPAAGGVAPASIRAEGEIRSQ